MTPCIRRGVGQATYRIDWLTARPYHLAVFSQTPFLPLLSLQIGLLTAFYFGCIWGWGSLISASLLKPDTRLSDFIGARVVTGCVALYAAFIALASIRHLKTAPVFGVLGLGFIFGLVYIRQSVARFQKFVREMAQRPVTERILFGILILLVVLQIACAFTPLIFYDSQVYQLLGPAEFLRAGYLTEVPWNVLANTPQAIQLTIGMSWALDQTGSTFKLLMALLGCVCCVAAARIGSEIGSRGALLAAIFVAAYPEFWIHQMFGVVDLGVAAFLLLGAAWWRESLQTKDWSRVLLAGAAFGFVIGSRYQGIVLVVLFAAVIWIWEGIDYRKAAALAGIAGTMTFPWLLRNYLHFHNPVYPILYGLFGGPEWSAKQAEILQSVVMGRGLSSLPVREMIVAPFEAILMYPSNGIFGIPLLICAVLAVSSRASKGLRLYALLGLCGLIAWGAMHPARGVELLRYNAGTLVLLLACAGALLAGRWLIAGLGLAAVSFSIGIVSLSNLVPVWPSLLHSADRMQLWRANVPSWPALDFANARLDPARDKILLIGEGRGLWLKPPFVAPSAYNGPQLAEFFEPSAGAAAWAGRLRALGITHILVCSAEWQRLADTTGYFRLPDDHLTIFLAWLHSLPVMFDDHAGNAVLKVP